LTIFSGANRHRSNVRRTGY